jgi:CheY-like chemotaxis protein
MTKVLVVDDEAIITMQLEGRLRRMGYKVVGMAASGEEAIEKARRLTPDIILMDIVMPGKFNGIVAARQINKELHIPVIFITSYADEKIIGEAKLVNPYGYIVKPFNELELRAAMELALYKKTTERKALAKPAHGKGPVDTGAGADEKTTDESGDLIVPERKAVLLDNIYQGIVLLLYADIQKNEQIFKFSIEHGLNNGHPSLFAYYHSKIPRFFIKDIEKENLITHRIKKNETGNFLTLIQNYWDTPLISDARNGWRILLDFSETDEFELILAIEKYILAKVQSGHSISGIIAVNIDTLSGEQIQKLSEGVTKVIVSTGNETSILIANQSYPVETLSVVPQEVVEAIVRKSLEPLVLSIMGKPMSGFDIVHEINNRYNVLIPQSRIYSILYELQQQGVLEIKTSGKSKLYCPSEKGKTYIRQKVNEFRFTFQHIFGPAGEIAPHG